MSSYTLLNKKIEFSKAEDNFYSIQVFFWDSLEKSKKEYNKWYDDQKNIPGVVNNIGDFVKLTIKNNVLDPLYADLGKKYELYGISMQAYIDNCLNISAISSVCNEAIEIYNEVVEQLQEELEEREYNEAYRKAGQISFGIGDSIKNAASNAAHGAAKATADANSREKANKQISKLYDDLRNRLWEAISDSNVATVTNYQEFVNSRVPGSIVSHFDKDQSYVYLENAKSVEEKREELIIEAFKKCPWNGDVYEYIFEVYKKERRQLVEISKCYGVDLTKVIDRILSMEYTEKAKKNEDEAIKAKRKIEGLLAEWGVEHSIILDKIETDCLDRLVSDYKTATEERCNELKKLLKEYREATDKNKKIYFEKIQKRIEEIWAKEDDKVFDNYLKQANILSDSEVKKGIKFIKKKGRTASAEKYITAFEHCNYQNIKKARTYHEINSKRPILKHLGWGLIGLALILLFVQENFSFWTQLLPALLGGAYQFYISLLKGEWESITIYGSVINPVLNLSKDDFDVKYAAANYETEQKDNNTQKEQENSD